MPWLPEFGVLQPIAAGDRIVVLDPQAGRVDGYEAFNEFAESSAKWLDDCNARTEWVASTGTSGRSVGELVTDLEVDGKHIALPIAVVAEQTDDHAEFRIYYSQWPLLGHHSVRSPILTDTGVEPQGWPARYHAALTAGDADAIAEAFEPDGYFREPAGADFVHSGKDLLPFFQMFFSLGGGIHLEHCAITDDGTRCCLEYNCVRWGDVEIPPQPGIGVYERGASGRLKAARVYDDVEPPDFG